MAIEERVWPFDPMEGQTLEFWTHRMSLEGTGIRGYFKGSSFFSEDGADAWGPGEIQLWQYTLGANGRKP